MKLAVLDTNECEPAAPETSPAVSLALVLLSGARSDPLLQPQVVPLPDSSGSEISSCHDLAGASALEKPRIQIPPHIQTMELSTPKPVSSCVRIFKA